MIIYGTFTETSVPKLFIAGVIPGLIMTACFMLYIAVHAKTRARPSRRGKPGRARSASCCARSPRSLPFVVLIAGTLGGLYFGVVTTTEAAVIGCFLSILLGVTFGDLTLRRFIEAMHNTINFQRQHPVPDLRRLHLLLRAQLRGHRREGHRSSSSACSSRKFEFYLALFVLFTVLGCLIESLGMIVITVPLLFPVLPSYGIDPILFGVILVIYIELGQISPPIGINLFVIQSIWDGKLSEVVIGTIPFHLIMFVVLALVIFWPELALWLPAPCVEMRRAEGRCSAAFGRILTTHTGSLPRPRELTRLYALRARGEAVDAAEIDRAGRDAVRAIVRKQREAGIDVGNNGEQQRDSFFLYLKARLSGLGGSWERPSRADVDRYPEFKRMWIEQHASRTQVSALGGLPKAIGEVRYLDDRAINDECRHFKAVLDENPGVFVEPFMSAPSPGILAMAVRNEHYDTLETYLAALGRGAAGRVRGDRAARVPAADRCARPRARAPHHLQGSAGRRIRRHSSSRSSRPSIRRSATFRATASACTCAGAIPNRRMIADVPLEDILPALQQANVGGFVLPFANPRHAHEFRCFAKHPLKDDQVLVAGVIDSLTNFVEHPEVVADRIERVARRRRRAVTRAGGNRLRLRYLGRLGPRRRGRGVGQAFKPTRRSAARFGSAIFVRAVG